MTRSRLIQSDGFNQLAATRHGYLLYNRNDVFIGRAIEKYGEYSALEMELFETLCSAGNAVIEVGANIGAHTVGFSRLVGAQGRVLAFEGNFGGLSLLGGHEGAAVPCFMLDRFIDLPRVNLLKIDVEGMEADVLKGGAKLINKFKPILYVENDRLDQSEALIRLIASFGYRLFWHLPPLFNPRNFYGEDENLYEDIISCNMLCLHRDADPSPSFLEEIVDFSSHPVRP